MLPGEKGLKGFVPKPQVPNGSEPALWGRTNWSWSAGMGFPSWADLHHQGAKDLVPAGQGAPPHRGGGAPPHRGGLSARGGCCKWAIRCLSRASFICPGFAAPWEATEVLGMEPAGRIFPAETHGRIPWTYKPFTFLCGLPSASLC